MATFRLASSDGAQIEIRASTGIDGDKQGSFFNSFHAKLKSAGFTKLRGPESSTHGKQKGRETEYEGRIRKEEFRLVVWTFHRGETAWILAGFFPAERRDPLYEDFESLAASLHVDDTD